MWQRNPYPNLYAHKENQIYKHITKTIMRNYSLTEFHM